MRMKLVAVSPDVETIIATAMLTTSSKREPSDIFERLRERPDRVEKLLKKVILKHGSILEHNRLVFLAEGGENEVLELLLADRFFEVSRLPGGRWLLSCNLRTLISVLSRGVDLPEGVREAFSRALREASPILWGKVMGLER